MTPSEFSVRKPVATSMLFISLFAIGLLALFLLSIDLFPDISPPSVSILTTYRGASAEDVEKKVTEIIEKQVSTVPNIKKVTSVSREGLSVVSVQFEWGTNIDSGTSDIRGALDFAVSSLPDDAERPSVFKFDFSLFPIMFISVTSKYNVNEMRTIVDREVIEQLKRVPGVGAASIRGGPMREVRIEFDRDKLNDIGLTPQQVAGIIGAQNESVPAGTIKNERRNYVLRVPGEFETTKELGDIIIGKSQDSIVRLKDVATIIDGYFEEDREISIDGKRAMFIILQKQSGANTVDVVDQVKKKLNELQERLPKDMKLDVLYDNGKFIRNSVNSLSSTIISGGIFVVLVVLLFLRNVRGSFIIFTLMPFSLIVAFIFFYINGFTINIISLSSLAIAIGMVVDNGIVVLENIYRHIERGEDPHEAAMYGASEVSGAILASTMTTAVIFVPIFFINDLSAILFQQLGYSIIMVLAASLLAALMLTPMLASKMLRVQKSRSRLFKWSETVFEKLENNYERILHWSVNNRKRTIVIAIFVLLVSIVTLKLFVGTEFMPASDSGQVEINVTMPQGTSFERTQEVSHRIRDMIREGMPEIERTFMITGKSEGGFSAIFGQKEDINTARITVQLIDKRKRNRSADEIAEVIRRKLIGLKEIEKLKVSSEDMFGSLFGGGGSSIQVEVYGYDLKKANDMAIKIENTLKKIDGIRNTNISRDSGKPEVTVTFNRDKLYALGLTVSGVGNQIRAQYSGLTATKYREGGDEFDVILRIKDDLRRDVGDLKGMNIVTPSGEKVPLANFATISIAQGPVEIERNKQTRLIYVTAGTYGRSFGEISADVKKSVESLEKPLGIDVVVGGQSEDQKKSFFFLSLAVLAGMILVYMVMAAQFESLRDPFIIMLSVPFAFSGVFFILAITGLNINIITFVGMLLLVGTVVNNAIVLIDYTNLLRAREYSLYDAVVTGGKTRLRPVLMTALTTIFGMLPLALSKGEGSESWVPLGTSVIGGLLFSTFVTLILIPTIYYAFEKKKQKNVNEWEAVV